MSDFNDEDGKGSDETNEDTFSAIIKHSLDVVLLFKGKDGILDEEDQIRN